MSKYFRAVRVERDGIVVSRSKRPISFIHDGFHVREYKRFSVWRAMRIMIFISLWRNGCDNIS